MANKASLETKLRKDFLAKIVNLVENDMGTDALDVSASEIAIPVVNDAGDETFILVKVSVPRGTRNGNGGYIPYDGYAAHQEYIEEQESKAQEKAARKAMKDAEKNKGKKKEDEDEDEE